MLQVLIYNNLTYKCLLLRFLIQIFTEGSFNHVILSHKKTFLYLNPKINLRKAQISSSHLNNETKISTLAFQARNELPTTTKCFLLLLLLIFALLFNNKVNPKRQP